MKYLSTGSLLVILFLLSACHKSGPGADDTSGYTYAQCRLSRLDIHDNTTNPLRYYLFIYRADGRLDTVRFMRGNFIAGNKAFQYLQNEVVITELYSLNQVTETDSVFFDAGTGHISALSYTEPGSPTTYSTQYFYTSGRLDSVSNLEDGQYAWSRYFRWQGNDLVLDSSQFSNRSYTYYNRPAAPPPGLFQAFAYPLSNYPFQYSEHLEKDIVGISHIEYTFDKGGKLIADTSYPVGQPQQTPMYETYNYDCR